MRLYRITNFIALGMIKLWARLFYRIENKWLHEHDNDPWGGVKLIVFLNHTSLYEPLFLGAAPWRMLWRAAGRIVVPAADVTLNRPIIGAFFRFFSPRIVSISRERDATWDNFINQIKEKSVVMIAPEGRMMRASGLDKHGNPMTVRGGIADILEVLPGGEMVIVYSGGLHHVQIPGQNIPRFFRRIQISCEKINIADYVQQMKQIPELTFKKAVIHDLESRLDRYKPQHISKKKDKH